MLTIRQAITLLRMDMDAPGSADIQDLGEAEKLGIETLKAWLSNREFSGFFHFPLLPGEDEEE